MFVGVGRPDPVRGEEDVGDSSDMGHHAITVGVASCGDALRTGG